MKAFYVPGTHWDREWYETFQEYRMWLVQTIDGAMDLLEREPAFATWHLDGQVAMIDDYLEIRPEARERLLGHIRAGRMPAGPWYVLADEWLVSDEALVRNLQVGMMRARRYGFEPMMIGYVPDLFGHTAGLPTILAGFRLKGCVMWRGAKDDFAGAQFVWKGPDGSKVITHKLPDKGCYGWFCGLVRQPWARGGHIEEELAELTRVAIEDERERLSAPVMLISDAMDHDRPDPRAPHILAHMREQFPDIEFVHSSLPAYFEELEKHRAALPERAGDLRMTAQRPDDWGWLIPHVLSARYPLKQLNDACQNLLTLWAEPLAAMAAASGRSVPEGFLETAWLWLLRNQPHDSICGCSIDAVHEDMMFRYRQALQLADSVRRQAFAALCPSTHHIEEGYRNLVVWNPLPWQREEVAVLELLFPEGFAPKVSLGHSGPWVNQFELTDAAGHAVPYQTLGIDKGRQVKTAGTEGRLRRAAGESSSRVDVYRVAVPLRLPAGGHTMLQVAPLEGRCYRDTGSLRTSPLAAENAHLRFELRSDGTGVLVHRATGRRFEGLFCYEDAGDAGDGWTFIPPAENQVVVSPGHSVDCAVQHDGSLLTTFRVERSLSVPESSDGQKRSPRRADLRITDLITLTAQSPFVHVRTVVENTARDHRLRVLLPSGVAADRYYSDQAFAFIERPVALDPANAHATEADPETRPHARMFGIQDERGGLAILCPGGLHEHAVLDDADRTLALTLLRAFGRTVMTDGEPGGQILGSHEFSYALFPYQGRLNRGAALRLTAELQAGVYRHYCAEPPGERSLVDVRGDEAIVVTSVKPAWGSQDLAVRLWNTAAEPANAEIRLQAQALSAWLCDLNEEVQRELPVKRASVRVRVPGLGLATVRIKTA